MMRKTRFVCPAVLKKILCLSLIASSVMATSACSLIKPVQAWEKGTLARPEMTFGGDKIDARNAEHIYASRESASGGTGVGSGGCGCN